MNYNLLNPRFEKDITEVWIKEQKALSKQQRQAFQNAEYSRPNWSIIETKYYGIGLRPRSPISPESWEEHGKLLQRAAKIEYILN